MNIPSVKDWIDELLKLRDDRDFAFYCPECSQLHAGRIGEPQSCPLNDAEEVEDEQQ